MIGARNAAGIARTVGIPAVDLLGRAQPALALVTQSGQPLTLKDLQGKVVLLTFTYSSCADVFPLITAAMVESMRSGSVIVDLAAETGGNCELTQPGETIQAHEVTIIAPQPSRRLGGPRSGSVFPA